ncbi:hypothetical protein [Candidatus Nitrotoga sp. 1052]|uniref:hypothetical protein n=1 Tax=Candidatus Nitrotoga sp. 1052 TaxID=2886964 RepID=UPI001EF66B16|nr:hypothetical protein [Candidatus Nitrotoga sp. 1052]
MASNLLQFIDACGAMFDYMLKVKCAYELHEYPDRSSPLCNEGVTEKGVRTAAMGLMLLNCCLLPKKNSGSIFMTLMLRIYRRRE